VRVRYVPGKRKILLDEKKGMNELLLLLAPLYLEVNNLRIFEPFLLLSAPDSCSTRGKIKKEKKLSRFFPFFL
jgi:hypothetical protein